jgi:hypothetical protein
MKPKDVLPKLVLINHHDLQTMDFGTIQRLLMKPSPRVTGIDTEPRTSGTTNLLLVKHGCRCTAT